jgi:hypothetical protein
MTPLFPLGQIVATPGALALLAQSNVSSLDLLSRHVSGDFGDIGEEDWKENLFSIKQGFRVLSSYRVGEGTIWLITEANRESSTLLLPENY